MDADRTSESGGTPGNTDFPQRHGIPPVPDAAGTLTLSGEYVRSLSELGGVVNLDELHEHDGVVVVGTALSTVVVYIDIGAFTQRSGELAPGQALYWVNRFFKSAWSTCQRNRGTFDKVIGDCLMVLFSEELGCPDPLESAMRVATEVIRWDTLGYDPHVGLAFGKCWLGYMGPPHSVSLSVCGRPANLAARLAGAGPERSVSFENAHEDFFRATEYADRFDLRGGKEELKDFKTVNYSTAQYRGQWCPQFHLPPLRLRRED